VDKLALMFENWEKTHSPSAAIGCPFFQFKLIGLRTFLSEHQKKLPSDPKSVPDVQCSIAEKFVYTF